MKIKVTPKGESEKKKTYPYLGIHKECTREPYFLVWFVGQDKGIVITSEINEKRTIIDIWEEEYFIPFEGTLKITI